jgi:hypothetical protein
MISGIEFYKLCDWNLCNRYPIKFDFNQISTDDFIFLNLDNFYEFISVLEDKNLPKFNLVTHNSDRTFDDSMLEKIEKYVSKVYAINSTTTNNQLVKIPLGFSDRLRGLICSTKNSNDKNNFLYMNFNIHSGRIHERTDCRSHFLDSDWVTYEDGVDESKYYDSLKNSKYSVCPVGAGLDTHRFYESLYFDTIPIIKRNKLSDLHSYFPCIIVEDWSEITYDFLFTNYDKNIEKLNDWKKINTKWSDADFWLKKY